MRCRNALALLILAGSLAGAGLALSQTGSYFPLEPDMCVRCHLLGENLGAPNPVLAWKRSVHFRADSGCAECHGGDKYLYADFQEGHLGRPDPAAAVKMCAPCHARETAPFLAPPPLGPGNACTVSCSDCHGYHEVKKASSRVVNPSTCGRCHAFALVKPGQKALSRAERKIASLERRLDLMADLGFPVASFRRELASARLDYADVFHSHRPGQYEAAAAELMPPLKKLGQRIKAASPIKWYFSGTLVIGLLVAIVALLLGYQAVINSNRFGKEDTEMEDKAQGQKCRGSNWTGRAALIIALAALILAAQERLMSPRHALTALNETVTKTLAPEVKKAADRDVAASVFELKHMIVTLDQIQDANDSPEVKAKIAKLKLDLQDLSVKLLVGPPAAP